MNNTATTPFIRDRFTWLAYLMLGYFAFFLAVPGIAMPLLRTDLNLSYTAGGLHVSGLALGMALAGLLLESLIRRCGRRMVFWGGGGGMAAGAGLLAAGRVPAVTIAGAFFMGLAGTTLLATIQAALSDHHGPRRALALTESNVVASAASILTPLLIGGAAQAGLNWRAGLLPPVLVWAIAFVTMRSWPLPPALGEQESGPGGQRLPRLYWLFWLALILSVAIEWSMITWGADFLVEAGGLAQASASLVMSAFFGAMLLGRFLGSGLARRLPVARLLLAAMLLGLAGFALFWMVRWPWLMVAALGVAGLGVANLFPFLLTLAMDAAGDQSDRASSRLTLGTGVAILLAPLTLGWTADRAGIETAYGLVGLLFALALALVLTTKRLSQR